MSTVQLLPPGMCKQFAKEAKEGKAHVVAKSADGKPSHFLFFRNRQEICLFPSSDGDVNKATGNLKKLSSAEWEVALQKAKRAEAAGIPLDASKL